MMSITDYKNVYLLQSHSCSSIDVACRSHVIHPHVVDLMYMSKEHVIQCHRVKTYTLLNGLISAFSYNIWKIPNFAS
jgi:hypothetical protein